VLAGGEKPREIGSWRRRIHHYAAAGKHRYWYCSP
jgi:hypothetical protein